MNKIKKGDEVIVITGKDKGKKGVILTVLTKSGKLLVEGINMAKKHEKPNPNANKRGGIVTKPMPIDRSNVMIYDSVKQKGTKIGIRTLNDGRRARFAKTSDQLIDVKE